MEKENKKSGMYWHCHHNILCEHVWDYDERVMAIRGKPKNEVNTRLRLFKKVKGKLPKKLDEAGKKNDEAWKKYYEAWKKYKPQLEKLHTKECGCKEWNGKEIVFEDGKRK